MKRYPSLEDLASELAATRRTLVEVDRRIQVVQSHIMERSREALRVEREVVDGVEVGQRAEERSE